MRQLCTAVTGPPRHTAATPPNCEISRALLLLTVAFLSPDREHVNSKSQQEHGSHSVTSYEPSFTTQPLLREPEGAEAGEAAHMTPSLYSQSPDFPQSSWGLIALLKGTCF